MTQGKLHSQEGGARILIEGKFKEAFEMQRNSKRAELIDLHECIMFFVLT